MSFITIYALSTQIKWFFVLCVVLFGLVGVGVRPVSISYGVELTFPMQPALTNGIMTFVANAVAFLLSLVINFVTDVREGDNQLD